MSESDEADEVINSKPAVLTFSTSKLGKHRKCCKGNQCISSTVSHKHECAFCGQGSRWGMALPLLPVVAFI